MPGPNSLIRSFQINVNGRTFYPSGIVASGSNVHVSANTGSWFNDIVVATFSSGGAYLSSTQVWNNIHNYGSGLALSAGGTFYNSDVNNYLDTVSGGTVSHTQVNQQNATDIAVDSNGEVYVAINGAIKRFSSDLKTVFDLSARSGDKATAGIAIDGQNNLYFIDNYVVRKYDVGGNFVATIGETAGLSAPIDVAVDNATGDVYVLDKAIIKRFKSDGTLLNSFGSGFSNPSSIAVDGSGDVYVADGGNATVYIFKSAR